MEPEFFDCWQYAVCQFKGQMGEDFIIVFDIFKTFLWKHFEENSLVFHLNTFNVKIQVETYPSYTLFKTIKHIHITNK